MKEISKETTDIITRDEYIIWIIAGIAIIAVMHVIVDTMRSVILENDEN